MRLLEIIGFQSPKIEDTIVETIKLSGPFIEEDYLTRHRDRYMELLGKTLTKCNLFLQRDLMVLSGDSQFSQRDNSRLQIGLKHHLHQFELAFRSISEYEILAIDHFVLLNPQDAEILKGYIGNHLPTKDELKRNYLTA